MLKVRITIIAFALILNLFFSSCKHGIPEKSKTITITLYNLSEIPKDKSKIYLDSIQTKYTQIAKHTQRVRRVFFLDKRENIIINYFLIKSGDSITYIKPTNDSTKSVYINLKSNEASRLRFNVPQQYLEATLKYIKTVNCSDKKRQIDKLLVLSGRDVGFLGGERRGYISPSDSIYYYCDKNIHLRKIVSKNGKLLYCDKNIYCASLITTHLKDR